MKRRSLCAVYVFLILVLGVLAAGCGVVEAFQDSAAMSKALSEAGYTNPNVTFGINTVNGVTRRSIKVKVGRPSDLPANDTSAENRAAAKVAEVFLKAYTKAQDDHDLEIAFTSGSTEKNFTRTVANWREVIADYNAPPGITNAVTSKETRGDNFEAVDPTTDFPAEQGKFHAVVSVRNLPTDTLVKVIWIAVDTHGAAAPNFTMTSTEVKVSGTRNVDFSLTPNAGRLPKGSYKVDVYLAEKLDRTLNFTVAGG